MRKNPCLLKDLSDTVHFETFITYDELDMIIDALLDKMNKVDKEYKKYDNLVDKIIDFKVDI